jgi:Cof subfamily protein (haloacid dehalogenase superfamily)
MTVADHSPAALIRAVISDVDGTLVTKDKRLTARTIAAAAALHAKGIVFAIISSRPPRGLRMFVEPLALSTPLIGFNGGMLVMPDETVLAQHLIDPQIARRAVAAIAAHGAQVWIFSGGNWLIRDASGPYIGLEERTVQFAPTTVGEFGASLDSAAKIVGVSDDFALLARCEGAIQGLLARDASVVRSQPYYLDITHPLANKGEAVRTLTAQLDIPAAEIATIGDGGNDIAMFAESGFSIAMGNASPEVKARAQCVTGSNEEDGFAAAMDRFILARAPSVVGAAS